jgi:hypothetical protein
MTQLQVYSNKLSLYYLFSYWIFVAFKFVLVGCILLYIYQGIQNFIRKYNDKINLLEGNLREIREQYDILLSELFLSKEENKNKNKNNEKINDKINLLEGNLRKTREQYDILSNELIVNKEENKNNNNKINLLEGNLSEINKKYDILLSELFLSKEENKNKNKNNDFINDKINLLEGNLRKTREQYDILSNELIVSKEENKKFRNEIIDRFTQRFIRLQDNLAIIEIEKSEDYKLIENKITSFSNMMKREICQMNSLINNNYLLIGYKIVGLTPIIPVLECSSASNIFEGIIDNRCDCFIVSQLKHFKNIKTIDIMKVVDKMFIFDRIDLNELYSNNERTGRKNNMLNLDRLTQENNPNYFVVCRGLFCYYNGNSSNGLALFREKHEYKMYGKNGVKKLHDKLKEINIDLLMPDELRDFVF